MDRLKKLDDIRRTYVIDGLRYSFEIENLKYNELWEFLRSIESKIDSSQIYEVEAINVLSKIWSLVDMTYRIFGLIQQVNGLSHKTNEMQIYLRATKQIEYFRNYFQHLRTEIPKISEATNPIMGSISWVNEAGDISYTIIPSSPCDKTSNPSCIFDTVKKEFIHKLQLAAGDKEISLCMIHDKNIMLKEFFYSWLKQSDLVEDEIHSTGSMKFVIQRKA